MRSPRATVAVPILLAVPGLSVATRSSPARRSRKATSSSRPRSTRPPSPAYQEAQRLTPKRRSSTSSSARPTWPCTSRAPSIPRDLEFANNAIKRLQTYLVGRIPTDQEGPRVPRFHVPRSGPLRRRDRVLPGSPEEPIPNDSEGDAVPGRHVLQEGRLPERPRVGEEAGGPRSQEPRAVRHGRRAGVGPLLSTTRISPPEIRAKIIADGMDALQTAAQDEAGQFRRADLHEPPLPGKGRRSRRTRRRSRNTSRKPDKYREQALELRKKSLVATPTPEPAK